MSEVVGQERFESDEIVPLHNEVARTRVSAGQLRNIFQQAEGHLLVMINYGFLPDPV